VCEHLHGRTVTEADTVWNKRVTVKLNQTHFNETHAPETEFRKRVVNGLVVVVATVR
jgi:acyl dehydratase